MVKYELVSMVKYYLVSMVKNELVSIVKLVRGVVISVYSLTRLSEIRH